MAFKRGDVIVVRRHSFTQPSISARIGIVLEAPETVEFPDVWQREADARKKYTVLIGTNKIMVDRQEVYDSFDAMQTQDEMIVRAVQEIKDAQAASPNSGTFLSRSKL